MAAYIIAFIDVSDHEQFARYIEKAPAIVKSFGGRYLARGGKTRLLEGEADLRRTVVLEFPDFETAEKFYHSEAYEDARALRSGAASADLLLVDGV